MPPTDAAPRTFEVMTKPVGPICNLDCSYCFYLEKEKLYPEGEKWQMRRDVLESYIRQHIQSQETPEVQFIWQGGEPTLLGIDYFRNVVALQSRYANGKRIHNAFQTNGVLLDDAWCDFFREQQFLIGLSIDGPRELHDAYRVDKQGRPTFEAVMRGLEALKKYKVEFNTLTVVSRKNSGHPLQVYHFLKEMGSRFLQFIPLVERLPDTSPVGGNPRLKILSLASPPSLDGVQPPLPVTSWSVQPKAFGDFLVRIFDEWVRHDVGRIFVRHFDVALGIWSGHGSSACVFSETCGKALALEHNGDLYSCDHFVYPQFKLGNLLEQPLADMVDSAPQRQFGLDKSATLPQYCRSCDVKFACQGECPKHRFLNTPDGEPRLNYLCAGYKQFFHHIDAPMRAMTEFLRRGQPPGMIMSLLRQQERGATQFNRNDPCHCGSGRKFKNCCGLR